MKRRNAALLAACLLVIYMAPQETKAQAGRREYAPASDHLINYGSANLNTLTSEDPGGNPDVPIDGGISLLVAAGIALGAKKAHASRKEKLPNTNP